MTSLVETQQPKLGKNDVVVDDKLAMELLPRRSFGAHKWDVGGVVIVAGSPGYYGAPMLSAIAAGRAGAGIVNLAVPRPLVGAIAIGVPEASFTPLPETESIAGARRAAEMLGERLVRAKALVIGPGLGQDEAADQLLRAVVGGKGASSSSIGFGVRSEIGSAEDAGLLAHSDRPVVFDADEAGTVAADRGNVTDGAVGTTGAEGTTGGVDLVAVGRVALTVGAFSSAKNARSARGSLLEALAGAAAAADAASVFTTVAGFAAVVVLFAAALVVVDFAVVVDFVVVVLFAAVEPTGFVVDVTPLAAPVTDDFTPDSSPVIEFFMSAASAIVFSNSPVSSDVMRRKSRTARPAWPMTSGSLPGPKMIRAATRMIDISGSPMPNMFMSGLDDSAAVGA